MQSAAALESYIPRPTEGLENGGNINFIPAKHPLETPTMGNVTTEDLQEILRGVLAEQKKPNTVPIPQWFIVAFTVPIVLVLVWFIQWRADVNNLIDKQQDRIIVLEKAKESKEEEERIKFREEVKQGMIDQYNKGKEFGYGVRTTDDKTGHR